MAEPFLALITPLTSGMAPGAPGVPTHPIYWPPSVWPTPPERPPSGRPPGTWGGSNEPFPTPPIVIPPDKPGVPPLVVWGGGNEPFPTPPIELPGQPPPPTDGGPPQRLVEWRTAWTQATGWVIIGIPQVPVPVPSAGRR